MLNDRLGDGLFLIWVGVVGGVLGGAAFALDPSSRAVIVLILSVGFLIIGLLMRWLRGARS
ncbi:hypothetical protein [Maricaulis sp.]|uniref:hypothetical protein n=1 Tax=Maricaulis sp. TaxID=1486257 RepID=UPI002623085A|nr:hypothetical protein [Maricaulis sp.]